MAKAREAMLWSCPGTTHGRQNMSNNVLVIAEQRDGVLKKVAFEMLGVGGELAAALGGQVEAALLGSGLAGLSFSM